MYNTQYSSTSVRITVSADLGFREGKMHVSWATRSCNSTVKCDTTLGMGSTQYTVDSESLSLPTA